MSFKFEYPHCGQRISAATEAIGAVGTCPTCERSFTVPRPPEGRAVLETGYVTPSGATHEVGGLKKVALWFSQRPRQSPAWRRTFTICVCGLMVVLGLSALVGLCVAFTMWEDFTRTTSEPSPTARFVNNTPFVARPKADAFQVSIRRVIGDLTAASSRLSSAQANVRESRGTFLAAIRQISIDGCPNDFAEAWVRYVTAVQGCVTVTNAQPETLEEHIVFGFLHGLNGEADGGTVRAIQEKKEVVVRMENALGEVAAVAARYGVH